MEVGFKLALKNPHIALSKPVISDRTGGVEVCINGWKLMQKYNEKFEFGVMQHLKFRSQMSNEFEQRMTNI